MEFNTKLQELRKAKGITQEELAKHLYVSRTAVSKWESGRGYPSLSLLKDLAKFFSVSVDDLLSNNELFCVAEQDVNKKEKRVRDLIFGMLDLSIVLLFFLPFFAQKIDGIIYEVSLFELTKITPFLKIFYLIMVLAIVLFGFAIILLQNNQSAFWVKNKYMISLALSVILVITFTISLQPYSAILCFVFLIIKAVVLKKWNR